MITVETIAAPDGWYWSDVWQKREAEADADIAAGRTMTFPDGDAFLAELDD